MPKNSNTTWGPRTGFQDPPAAPPAAPAAEEAQVVPIAALQPDGDEGAGQEGGEGASQDPPAAPQPE